ncbi:hypothetical protein QLQ12_38650 [Actinoplanes sp. NEAU-A12]|uniref:Uncharacterized protein n=1 Tax=Actinoplanes sandaracinus TaxID=3045177 RepID=A0ABT6WXR8_9ACTN|nr:hypothetical protein [Actinoplanes sandaracinus]MDI6104527.1 hypothetical protein [Actinoplanes sandaracinus]
MEPTSSPDNTRPSPGLARFWQVRPEPESPSGGDEPLESPADLLAGSPLGTFRSRPIPPLAPIASVARHPGGAADPFGLNRAAARGGSGGPRNPAANRPASGQGGRDRHGDTDHSVPPDDQREPVQDVKSGEPEGGGFGGFGLGGRAGRFLFGGRDGDDPEPAAEDSGPSEEGIVDDGPQAAGPRSGDPQVGDAPTDGESAGATAADEPAEQTPPDAGQEAAEVAGPSDENGREDMNGRAGAPGYAQTGEAVPDGTGEPVDESPGQGPADMPRPAAGWATVPGTQPVSDGPVSGAPVSPAYAPNPYSVADFTPDHPAGNIRPVSGLPGPVSGPPGPEPEPADPAATAPVSPAHAPTAPPASASASVQIPASRTPPDLTIDLGGETPDGNGYPSLPPAAESGYGFAPTGYSLGRPAEAFGVASVTPAAPPAGSVAPPPPLDFLTFPPAAPNRRAREESTEESAPSVRRSASLEDVEPVRRAGRRAAQAGESAPAPADRPGDEPLIGRTVWDEDAARHFRAAWHEVKAEFVDDPVTALTRAHDLLTDAVNELTEVLLAERDELDPLRGSGTPDTESMRMAMRGYREYLERILSL